MFLCQSKKYWLKQMKLKKNHGILTRNKTEMKKMYVVILDVYCTVMSSVNRQLLNLEWRDNQNFCKVTFICVHWFFSVLWILGNAKISIPFIYTDIYSQIENVDLNGDFGFSCEECLVYLIEMEIIYESVYTLMSK